MAARPVLPNLGKMSDFVGAFEVRSRLTGQTYQVRFSHLWNAISTRHSDTVDTKFFVDGRGVVVGLAHTGVLEAARRLGRTLSDRELSHVAAAYLRARLEEEDERALYDVPHAEVLRLVELVGIRD